MNRVVVGLFLIVGASLAQTPPEEADLSRFAVASIRPSSPDELGGPSGMQGNTPQHDSKRIRVPSP